MADCITYDKIPYYSDLILDYLSEKKSLQFSYHRFPTLKNLKKQFEEKAAAFPHKNRASLVTALQAQYKEVNTSSKTAQNIERLGDENTFTITTGHQLNLFTGPLFFFYKIVSAINLTKQMKKAYPDYNFVPVFWMASEDHDFEEINFFNFKNHKLQWNSEQTGAVGRFSTKGLEDVFKQFEEDLNNSVYAKDLKAVFKEAYLAHNNLAAATRYLANEFLGKYGLVILDGDDKELKKLFIPQIKNELIEQTAFQNVSKTAEKLEQMDYTVQVNPRDINLFYLNENSRDRIVKEEGLYFLHGTEKRFTEKEILKEVDKYPERFSPNAIMRPLYQEVILPNITYVGGSGELAYWLELKDYFTAEEVVFPSLLLRNSALLMTAKEQKKQKKLNISLENLFLEQSELISKQTKAISSLSIDFSPQKKHLKEQFKGMYELAEQTDKSFYGAVAAQEQKQLNGLDYLEKRLLKAQKRQLKDELNRTRILQDQLFPNNNLQEREENFSSFYESYGDDLIELLFAELQPLEQKFAIITLE